MNKLIVSKSILITSLMISGSHAMEPFNAEGATPSINQGVCVENKMTLQPETMMIAISEERVADILKYLQRNYWGLTLSLSELKDYLLPDSSLPNDMKASVLRGIPSATEEEMRCALKGIYSRNRRMDILDCLVLKCKLHDSPLFELESLLVPNSPLPEDIKTMVWKTVPNATEEEMRLQIKLIYSDKKKPSLRLC